MTSSLSRLSLDGRAMSTTLDVTLCLLMVSAAVGVLVAAGPGPAGHDPATADRAAERIGTATVSVDYALPGEAYASASARQRTVHGTLAALLARAAVDDLHVGPGGAGGSVRAGVGLEGTRAGESERTAFDRALANRTKGVLADVDATVNVTATYAPCPGASVEGEAAVGPAPPATADVSVARIRVPVGAGGPETTQAGLGRTAREDGFAGVARALADAAIATLAPSQRSRWSLRDPATSAVVASRYQRLAAALEVDVQGALAGSRTDRANDRLASALADRCRAGLQERYDTPADAVDAIAGTAGGESATAEARTQGERGPRVVTITVRTWSA